MAAAPAKTSITFPALQKRVNRELVRTIATHKKLFLSYGSVGRILFAEMQRALLAPGKRIRGSLVLLTYAGYTKGRMDIAPAIPAAVAYEFLQQFLLIHDDIIDQDDLRRGQPTTVAQFRHLVPRHVPAEDRNHFAKSMAIVEGDLLNTLAFELIVHSSLSPTVIMKAVGSLGRTQQEVIIGEFLDVFFERDWKGTQKSYELMVYLKTSSYTFIGPMMLGATLAAAPRAVFPRIQKFGALLGLAFQLQDDYLGVFGTIETFGKRIGNDLEEGQQTLLTTLTLNRASGSQKRYLRATLGHRLARADLVKIRGIMQETGAVADVQRAIAEAFEAALQLVPALGLTPSISQTLQNFVYYLQSRER